MLETSTFGNSFWKKPIFWASVLSFLCGCVITFIVCYFFLGRIFAPIDVDNQDCSKSFEVSLIDRNNQELNQKANTTTQSHNPNTTPNSIFLDVLTPNPKNMFTSNPNGVSLGNSSTQTLYPTQRQPEQSFMAFISLDTTFSFTCVGTRIHRNFILTAAHCVDSPHNILVHVGMGTLYESISFFRGPKENIIMHPSYTRKTLANDIALIKLPTSVTQESSTIVAIADCIYLVDAFCDSSNRSAVVMGWNGDEIAVVENVTIIQCSEQNRIFCDCPALLHQEVYSVNNNKVGPYWSGGPLLWNNMQIGIISGAIDDACNQSSLVKYTIILYYLTWIQKTITTRLSETKECYFYNEDQFLPPDVSASNPKDAYPRDVDASTQTLNPTANQSPKSFMAYVLVDTVNGTSCAGTRIHRRFVLTAAHCVDSVDNVLVCLEAWDISLCKPSLIFNITRNHIITHDDYIQDTLTNDIALIRLPTTVPNENRTIVAIADCLFLMDAFCDYSGDRRAVAMGWELNTTATVLTENVTLIPCFEEDTIFCTCPGISQIFSEADGKLGPGWSGGPLLWNNMQFGIISGKMTTTCFPSPIIAHTNVLNYSDWIYNVIIMERLTENYEDQLIYGFD